MYSLGGYGSMISDHRRMEAYALALRRTITPRSIVVDIGTGPGILTLLACQFGARKVYAIEPADAIAVARAIAHMNGYADHIEFIQQRSDRVTLPERADVIVSDLRGVLPLFLHHLPSIIDARRRFLKSDGRMIPQSDRLWAAVVHAPELYSLHVDPWDRRPFGLDMGPARAIETNTWTKCRVRPEQLLVSPQPWVTLDYTSLDQCDAAAALTWTADSQGEAHGLVMWFDSILTQDVRMTNDPNSPELVYAHAFFPWPQPVALAVGDKVSASIQARLVGEDYVWRWETTVLEQGQPDRVKAAFKQSTFYGAPLSLDRLHKRAVDHVPALNEDGQIDHLILESLDAHLPLGQIADWVMAKFPTSFRTWDEVMAHVADLSAKYSQ